MIISGEDAVFAKLLESDLTYTDKAKQYQLRRLSKSVWGRSSPLYKQLQLDVKGNLYKRGNLGEWIINSSFLEYFQEIYPEFFKNAQVTDLRKDTGTKIVVPWINKPNSLRPYQQEAVDLMLSNHRGVINFATGLGKTLVATHFIQQYKKRALVVCPSDSVAKQFYEQFVKCFGKKKVGFYGGGKKEISDITVGIAASVSKYVKEFQSADLGVVIFDETHHTPAATFFDIAEGLCSIGKIFGLTATDYRGADEF